MMNPILKKRISLTLVFITVTLTAFAQDEEASRETQTSLKHQFRTGVQSAYYFPNQKGYSVNNGTVPIIYGIVDPGFTSIENDKGRTLGSTWGALELQGWGDYTLTIPVLTGTGALTKDNNLRLNGKISISPVTMGLDIKATLTPIAFLKLEAGSHLGTGWTIDNFANGLGLNSDGSGNPDTSDFPGVVNKVWIGGTFQFDLSAVLPEPNDWTHIVLQSNINFEYQVFSGAANGEAWQYLADNGENLNGWRFLTSSVLGYQIMDFPINFVGFMIDTKAYLGKERELSFMKDNGWGSDFISTRFGPLINWQISDNHAILLLAQWSNEREYTSETIGANYFKNRKSTGNYYLFFERIAVSYTWNF